MKNKPKTLSPYIIYLFFIIGLISAFSFRVIIILQHFSADLITPVWYIGAIGYLFFFLYRYIIAEKRKKAIREYQLIEKLDNFRNLNEQDVDIIRYLLSSIQKSRENWNYLFIFILSAVTIILDLYLRFSAK